MCRRRPLSAEQDTHGEAGSPAHGVTRALALPRPHAPQGRSREPAPGCLGRVPHCSKVTLVPSLLILVETWVSQGRDSPVRLLTPTWHLKAASQRAGGRQLESDFQRNRKTESPRRLGPHLPCTIPQKLATVQAGAGGRDGDENGGIHLGGWEFYEISIRSKPPCALGDRETETPQEPAPPG